MLRRASVVLVLVLTSLALALAGCGGGTKTQTVTSPAAPAPHVTTPAAAPPQSICLNDPSNPEVGTACKPEGQAGTPSQPPVASKLGARGPPSIDEQGLRLIEQFEGYSRCAYWDSYGGVWTAGFGQTQGIYGGFCFASFHAAEVNLERSVVREYQWAVDEACGTACGQHQVNGLVSFAYNLGAYIFRNNGSLFADIHRGAFHSACSIIRGYAYAGGVYLSGLARRRGLECAEIERPVVKPKPLTRAQIHAKRVKLLRKEKGYYASLTSVLGVHNCDRHRFHHPRNATRKACETWQVHRGQAHDQIERLHKLGIR